MRSQVVEGIAWHELDSWLGLGSMEAIVEGTDLLRDSLWLLLVHRNWWVQLHSLELWSVHSVGLIIIIIFKLLLIDVGLFLCKPIKLLILWSSKHWGALLSHKI